MDSQTTGEKVTPAYRYRAKAIRVIDGDTYVLSIDLGFRCSVEMEGRLRGVDCPEMNTAEGKAAREFVILKLAPLPGVIPDPVIVESYKDHRSFARWVVDVYLPDGSSLADVLVLAGHAIRI